MEYFGITTVWCILSIVWISCTNIIAASQLAPETQKAIDDLVQSEMITKGKIPAVSLGVTHQDALYTTAYGMRDLENSILADKSTLFFIGSVSKSFAATIVVKVLSEKFPELGDSVLDTPIRQLAPSYNFTLSDRYRSERTSFKDLLAHRVGETIPSLGQAYGAILDPKELAYRLRYAKEQHPFRTNLLYNNGHFGLATEVIGEIAGVPFLQLLEKFLADLNMTSTTYVKASDNDDNMGDRAIGYYHNGTAQKRFDGDYFKYVLPFIGAGGIISNSEDMVKYALFHLNLGKVGDTQLIPQKAMKWMQSNYNAFPVTFGWKTDPSQKEHFVDIGYGLGFFLSTFDGWQVVQHGGLLTPFTTQFTLIPALNLSIFTSSSSNGDMKNYYLPQMELHKEIFRILIGHERTDLSKVAIPNIPNPFEALIMSLTLVNSKTPLSDIPVKAEEILGHYGNGQMGEMDITEKMNSSGQLQPYLSYGKFGYGWLHQIANSNVFTFKAESSYAQSLYGLGLDESAYEPTLTYDPTSHSITFNNKLGGIGVFEKNLKLSNLPAQPWDSASCGPNPEVKLVKQTNEETDDCAENEGSNLDLDRQSTRDL